MKAGYMFGDLTLLFTKKDIDFLQQPDPTAEQYPELRLEARCYTERERPLIVHVKYGLAPGIIPAVRRDGADHLTLVFDQETYQNARYRKQQITWERVKIDEECGRVYFFFPRVRAKSG